MGMFLCPFDKRDMTVFQTGSPNDLGATRILVAANGTKLPIGDMPPKVRRFALRRNIKAVWTA